MRCRCSHLDVFHELDNGNACLECPCKNFSLCPHDKLEPQKNIYGGTDGVCVVCGATIGGDDGPRY